MSYWHCDWISELSVSSTFSSPILVLMHFDVYLYMFDQCEQDVDFSINCLAVFASLCPAICVYLLHGSQWTFFLSYLSRSLADRWGTTVDFTTSFLHSSRFSAFRSVMFHGRPVHSLMLSSHRFLCLPLRLPPWTVPCRIVLASPDDFTCKYLCVFRWIRILCNCNVHLSWKAEEKIMFLSTVIFSGPWKNKVEIMNFML